MKEIRVNSPKLLTVPTGATNLVVVHEWGDIVETSAVTEGETYSFTPDSIGVHEFTWLNSLGQTVQMEHHSSYLPLVEASDFFADHELLEEYTDDFKKIERIVRLLIQNYTGQLFGPYVNKSLEIQGDGGDFLYLPVRIMALTSVLNGYGDDSSELLEISPNESTILQRVSRFNRAAYGSSDLHDVKRDISWDRYEAFSPRHTYSITGDWGWRYVPMEVSEASKLLISEILGDDDILELKRKGVFEAQLGDFKLRLNADMWGTTGNVAADNLLSPYVLLGIGIVI